MSDIVKVDSAPIYNINLDEPLERRLKPVIDGERETAKELFREARKVFHSVPQVAIELFGVAYRGFKGPYQNELQKWADALETSFGEVAFVNCAYELSHLELKFSLPELLIRWVTGCTTAVRQVDGLGMVHLRTLDWPIPAMGQGTRLFRYFDQDDGHQFITVGFPASVGALSGIVPGAYSVTINWAPPVRTPDFYHGPAFYLRQSLAECRTFHQIVERLQRVHLSTGVFFTVCGTQPGEACIIERTAREAKVRPLDSTGVEAQSNHYIAFQEYAHEHEPYREDELIRTTEERREKMLEAARGFSGRPSGLEGLIELLDQTQNSQTVQRMAFCPAKGELVLDRLVSKAGEEKVWLRSRWPQ